MVHMGINDKITFFSSFSSITFVIPIASHLTEKTKRPKLEELKKKERKQVRKQMNSNFELAQKAKNAWEVVRK